MEAYHSILASPVPQDKGRQIDCSGVAMDCEKQICLVVCEEDPSKQKPLSLLKTRDPIDSHSL